MTSHDELSLNSEGLPKPFQVFIEYQLHYVIGKLTPLAQEINKTEFECIEYFIKANENFQPSDFTPQFLIGCVAFEAVEMLNNINIVGIDQALRKLFLLASFCGSISSLISNQDIKTKLFEEFKRDRAKTAVAAKLANDPKQKALKEIEAKYQDVKHTLHLHGRTAQFGRKMHAEYPIFDDIATINRLVAKLNKSNELIPKK